VNPQLALDFSKRARRRDPQTSHDAAARLAEFAHDHHAKILGSLVTEGKGTIHEIAASTGLDHVAVARRLPELEALMVARPTQETKPSPKGRACRVWEACR
jgi:predicted ArsR family transcriptional regulator